MEIWTIQMGKWRQLPPDIKLIDTTVMSGYKPFAPTWELLKGYQAGKISAEEYSVVYKDKIADFMLHNQNVFTRLASHPKIALACYCKAGDFCHRHLLAELLRNYYKVSSVNRELPAVEVTLMGEYTA